MSGEESEEGGIYVPPIVYSIANLVMTLAFIVAGLSLAYLLYGVFVGLGGFSSWDAPKQKIMMGNIALATKALIYGMGAASLGLAVSLWFEEIAGYALLIGAALLGLGLPMLGDTTSLGVAKALAAFPQAALVPGGVGLVLVLRDIIAKFGRAIQRRGTETDSSVATFGTGAKRESKPIRTSLIGKCWEGSYCRDWVRPHCPIYQKRDACWRIRRGCYCEQDIVSAAANKTQGGVQLEMAPASQLNYANPSSSGSNAPAKVFLTDAQKAERCRNCVIYNDHQSDKYKVIMPITIVATIALCVLISPMMRTGIQASMTGIESIASKLSFASSQESGIKLTRPSDGVLWALVGAFSLMIVSKVLQIVEWCIFVKKI